MPIEFDSIGKILYPRQLDSINTRLTDSTITEVFLFVHGWDKTPAAAERDYQDFICRFYKRGTIAFSMAASQGYGNPRNTFLIIGVFWPSTVFPNGDPNFIKFATFYPIHRRAEKIAESGFRELLLAIQTSSLQRSPQSKINLRMIGHSFGARILLSGLLLQFPSPGINLTTREFFKSLQSLDLVLLEAAIPQKFEVRRPVHEFLLRVKNDAALTFDSIQYFENFLPQARELLTHLRIFNIFSENDLANRYLFPIGSLLTNDMADCAIGGCGIYDFPTLTVDSSGRIGAVTKNERNIWNVNASMVITSHSDIYKGRVVELIWDLLSSP